MQTTIFLLHRTLMKDCQKQTEHNITKFINFFANSQLVVNKQKTEYIVFSTRKRLTNTALNVDNKRIAESNRVKYLSVIINSKLNLIEQ